MLGNVLSSFSAAIMRVIHILDDSLRLLSQKCEELPWLVIIGGCSTFLLFMPF